MWISSTFSLFAIRSLSIIIINVHKVNSIDLGISHYSKEIGRRLYGSYCVSGTWGQQECDQGSQQRLTTLPNVMNELEETQVERQLLLRDPPMGAQPGPEQRPEAFDRVDMDFAESIAVLVAGELTGRMADGAVRLAPCGQPSVAVAFV